LTLILKPRTKQFICGANLLQVLVLTTSIAKQILVAHILLKITRFYMFEAKFKKHTNKRKIIELWWSAVNRDHMVSLTNSTGGWTTDYLVGRNKKVTHSDNNV
jgi:hypothetical protein